MNANLDGLSVQELFAIVKNIREILWSNEDPDNEWDSDTTLEIADVLGFYGLCPEEKIPE